MKVVLEIGSWILVEDDDDPDVRLWHNSTTQETRPYKEIPDEVEEYLRNQREDDSGSADKGPSPLAAADPPPKEAVPFRRERGVADSGSADVPFTRERGVASASTGDAPVPFKRERGVADSVGSSHIESPAPYQQRYPGSNGMGGRGAGYADMGQMGFELGGGTMREAPPAVSHSRMAQPEDFPELPPPETPEWLAGAPVREPTVVMMVKGTTMKQKKEESKEKLLLRVTHMQLQEQHLTVLGNLVHNRCPKLRFLYLSDNQLHTMGLLVPGLEVLVLQSNKLWEMGSWSQNLPRLESLDLRDNRLSLVDGLNRSSLLKELNLSGQRGASPLQFQRSTLLAISPGLRSLDVARNQISNLAPLACLSQLERLDASGNAIDSTKKVTPALSQMRMLTWLCLEGNPFCQTEKRYRDDIIAISLRLEELDGKLVSRNEKMYVGQVRQRRNEREYSEVARRGRSRGPSAPPQMQGMDSGSGHGSPSSQSAARTGTEDSDSLVRQRQGRMEASPATMRSASQPPRRRSSSAAKRFAGPRRQLSSGGSASAARLPPLMPSSTSGQSETMSRPVMQRSHDLMV